tara:strand:- start:4380 stop:5303 length:924 start_codon:yes stop_codon:yes gene_type:complete
MDKLKDRFPFHLFLMVLAMFLSMTTIVLATVPLFLLRASAGRAAYYTYSILVVLLMGFLQGFEFVIPISACILLVGVFHEARLLTCNVFQSGFASLLVVLGSLCLVLASLIRFQGLDLIAYATQKLELLLSPLKEVQPDMVLDTNKILMQMPSAIVMIFMISLWLGIVGRSFLVKKYKIVASHLDKQDCEAIQKFDGTKFHLPSSLIWPALIFMALSFLDLQQENLQVIASNFLNIFIVLYFFQGIALVAYLFRAMEMGAFWQWFWYILLVLHMFLLVSSIGFADYWINFREKINRHFLKAREGRLK